MPVYFMFFLATLAAAVLLYVGAVVVAGIMRKPIPALVKGRGVDRLQTLHLALVWMNVGVCWFAYFNVYRIHVDMAAVGDAAFLTFARGYTSRLAVVVLPYGAGALAAALALWAAPGKLSRRALWGIATLWLLSVASTPWAAGAQGDMHDHGFTDASFQQMMMAHLVRSLCVSAAGLWALLQDRRSRP